MIAGIVLAIYLVIALLVLLLFSAGRVVSGMG